MRTVWCLLTLALTAAIPLSVPDQEDSRLDRIEKDVGLLSGLLRNIFAHDADAEEGTPLQVEAKVTPKSKQASRAPEKLVALQLPHTGSSPLDTTIDFFPTSIYKTDIPHMDAEQGRRKLFVGRMPEVEGTISRMSPIRNRDAVVCPGYPDECSGHGMCDEGLCHCDNSWTKYDCSELTCFPVCETQHGFCNNGTCDCMPGWQGDSCETPDCFPKCVEANGYCGVSGLCICHPGWEGDACELQMCPNNCSNKGKCNGTSGACICEQGWGGEDCSKVSYPCVYECMNGGQCSNGTCDCTSAWQGLDCGEMRAPEMRCEGGAVWTKFASPLLRTCENLREEPSEEAPLRSTTRCACPATTPIWDGDSHQCVTEEFCVIGECGELGVPHPDEIIIGINGKPRCDWSSPGRGLGCADGSTNVTICFKAGHTVAQQIAVSKDAAIVLFRKDSPCGSHSTIAEFSRETVPMVETSNSTSLDENSATLSMTKVVTYEYPDFEHASYIMLSPKERKAAGSASISIDCLGTYEPRVVIVSSILETTIVGTNEFVAENASCPGVTPCNGNGHCQAGFRRSVCHCSFGFIGNDCSARKVHNTTILPNNITTVLPIPPDAEIIQEPESVTVVTKHSTYVFHPDGTIEIHNENGGVTVTHQEIRDEHGCSSNTEWNHCTPGCFPTCRNPNPRCTPTCLRGSCQCPPHLPVWDDIQNLCVGTGLCSSQSPCPGIGAMCSNKGSCLNGTCLCSDGFGGDDCSVANFLVPRVTLASGTVQQVRLCAFPFEFRGRTYTDCTTDFDSQGLEWCSATHEWDNQWGYCDSRGTCPATDGISCNGRGVCVSGKCHCDDLWSGDGCTNQYIRYDNVTFTKCHLPFIGPDSTEVFDCLPGVPKDQNGELVVISGVETDSWCLTTFRYEGPHSLALCQPAGQCGNCSAEGGMCAPKNTGKCVCRPGYHGNFCDERMTERDILLGLFVDTQGEDWNRHSNWGNEGSPCQEPGWTGITCRDGHVVRISLDSTGLKGPIPEDLSQLDHLEALDLSNNALVGTFPSELLQNPASLVSISVSGNWLVGSLPLLPSRILYADFSQNYVHYPDELVTTIVPRVTDGSGSVPAFTHCSFPFEYYGQTYHGCTTDWTSSGKAWCSTTGVYTGLWGNCADIGTCPGEDGVECSGNGGCVQELSSKGLLGRCECHTGFTGTSCNRTMIRVTKTSMIGQVEEYHGKPCELPFVYQGKEYNDCTTDGSTTGEAWCLLTNEWERKWGYCAAAGACPGSHNNCSGHGLCEEGVCHCHEGWIWNDCSMRAPRVVTGDRTGSVGKPCHFPFTIEGSEYHACAVLEGEESPMCATESGSSPAMDVCADIGTCPGSPECSGHGYCDSGECICSEGYQGLDCGAAMGERDILVKFFRKTNGLNWLESTKWEEADHCLWFGVTCNVHNQTTQLELPFNNLDGALPGDIALLPALEKLDLAGNLLAGAVPSMLTLNPNIHVVNLSSNQLVGDLPLFQPGVAVACDGNCIENANCAKGACAFPF